MIRKQMPTAAPITALDTVFHSKYLLGRTVKCTLICDLLSRQNHDPYAIHVWHIYARNVCVARGPEGTFKGGEA